MTVKDMQSGNQFTLKQVEITGMDGTGISHPPTDWGRGARRLTGNASVCAKAKRSIHVCVTVVMEYTGILVVVVAIRYKTRSHVHTQTFAPFLWS